MTARDSAVSVAARFQRAAVRELLTRSKRVATIVGHHLVAAEPRTVL